MAFRSLKPILDFQCNLFSKRPTTLCRSVHHSNDLQQKEATKTKSKDEEFRVFEIEGLKREEMKKRMLRRKRKMPPARFRSMAVDQDWTNAWPTAATFKWSAVPFPVRQGYVKNSAENEGIVPSSYGNLELMKPPNFLHLTPAHIKKQCAVLKKFCTDWPEGLKTDEECQQHFPIESVTSDYVFSGPSIADERARFASMQFRLSDLDLDYHAKDKFIRLVGERYDPETGIVKFESDRCPLKTQNLDYIKFLLTAVYFESWKREGWEDLKTLQDMEKYVWEMNKSRDTVLSLLNNIKETDEKTSEGDERLSYLPAEKADADVICGLAEVQKYKVAVEELFNEGENIETLTNYKNSVKKLLNLRSEGAL